MKKAFLAILLGTAALTSVKGQMAKGNLFVGTDLGTTTYSFGNYSYNFSDGNLRNQDAKDYSLGLSPTLGVFVTDHLIFGGTLNFDYSHDKNNVSNTLDGSMADNSTTNSTTFSLGPFLRYYFFNSPASKTLFYLQANAAAGTGGGSTNETTLNASAGNTNSTGNINNMFIFKAGGSLGVTHLIQKNIGLDIGIGYQYLYQRYTNNLSSETTTGGNAGTTVPSSYKATLPVNGITIAAGFHFFVP